MTKSTGIEGASETTKSSDGRSTAIIVSVSSDIGTSLAQRWLAADWRVFGTYRTGSAAIRELERNGLTAMQCDMASPESVSSAVAELTRLCPAWDALVLCTGTMDPIGEFATTDFAEWERSVHVNFTSLLGTVHGLLGTRRVETSAGVPCVLFFAGGGTNNAVPGFSAYTVSKIALIKMCELLDAEIPDTKFSIIGPGFVRTKIHEETLRASERAGVYYDRTVQTLEGDSETPRITPMEDVLDCCDWVLSEPRDIVSGRNFSVVYDRWGDGELDEMLSRDQDMYKLRRSGNDKIGKTVR